MSKESKIIKDLKERNYKLATQYRYKDIRCASLEQKNQKYKEVIEKAIEYINTTDCCTWDNIAHEDLLNILSIKKDSD